MLFQRLLRKLSMVLCCLALFILAVAAVASGRCNRDPFYKVLRYGSYESVKAFIKSHPGDVDLRDECSSYTPLMQAAQLGRTKVVALLIIAGANVHARDRRMGDTALHKAAWSGKVAVARLLLAKGAKVNAKNTMDRRTPLHHAVDSGMSSAEAMALLLIKKGALVNARDRQGNTPLLVVLGSDMTTVPLRLKIARLLIKHGARVNARNRQGQTPLRLLKSRCARDRDAACPALIQFLKQSGAK